MSTISIHRTQLLTFSANRSRTNRHKIPTISASWTMIMDSKSSNTRKTEELSLQLTRSSIPEPQTLDLSRLKFDRLQLAEDEVNQSPRIEFGRFVAREAVLDEEYWTAAWLRAESHWEDRRNERYVDNYKRKFAEQEFNAIKRRCKGLHGQKCMCIVTDLVKKKERNVKCSVLKSVVGTLDLSIRYLLHGETFPGERVKVPSFSTVSRTDPNRYGYVANLCVAKSARRQGIASSMLHFAIESAKSRGIKQVYVHVDKNNIPAQELYKIIGFEMISMAHSQQGEEQTYLLCFKA
ncbi:uncharacterized protein LOC110817673 isoform X3 [Carica papaya]|uniref:uncharacterized protein LOC110817673 isoform X3 n=1 Tax=Carica papaya TaxID=3649 RepID=UPI000B8D09BE|nr:uncharacterized protein LOC110817673 isoform X3 [Carica papaya]